MRCWFILSALLLCLLPAVDPDLSRVVTLDFGPFRRGPAPPSQPAIFSCRNLHLISRIACGFTIIGRNQLYNCAIDQFRVGDIPFRLNQLSERMDDGEILMQKCSAVLAAMNPSATQVQLLAVQGTLERNKQLIAELKTEGKSSADMALCLQELNSNFASIARLWQLTSGSSS